MQTKQSIKKNNKSLESFLTLDISISVLIVWGLESQQ